MVQVGANYFGRSRVVPGMTGRTGMTGRVEQLAWMTLAGGWLAAFTLTAGVANLVRPYRTARAGNVAGNVAAPRDDRYRSAPSS
jgi:hypothetical protein